MVKGWWRDRQVDRQARCDAPPLAAALSSTRWSSGALAQEQASSKMSSRSQQSWPGHHLHCPDWEVVSFPYRVQKFLKFLTCH